MKKLLLLVSSLLVSGCAWTEITAFKDPAFKDATYHKILIMARLSELRYESYAEEKFGDCLSNQDVNVICAKQLFPPTRERDPNECVKIIRENGFDAVLFIALEDFWTDIYTTPPSSSTRGSGFISGGMISYRERTTYDPGTTYILPRAKFEVRLVDVDSENVAWMASTFSHGNAFADIKTIVDSLARETVTSLQKEGLICRK